MNLLKLFGKKAKANVKKIDPINRNYVCMTLDPIASMNDLRKGDWNMGKVKEGLAMGMLRYPRQSEVDKAFEVGRLSE